jgi:phenylalanyl-tRNA synthetase beta chain
VKVSKKWIEQYAAIPVDVEEYKRKMVMHGTGVESIEDMAAQVTGVVVGRILSVAKHEASDHLVICRVDVGDETLQIVTGAPNVAAGQLVPVAKDGACLPGGKRIKAGILRGAASQGMLCSGPELGVPAELYTSVGDEGILIFQEDYPLGADVRPILGIDDAVVDFDILANRPDCQCVWGVARETAVALGTAFHKPDIQVATVPGAVEDFVHITVQDDDLCPRYVGRVVKNVRIGPSPLWLRAALHAAGMRAINNIVDITNYVMLETGHPMHAFNLAKVRGGCVVVRRARPGESIRTLDGKLRETTPDMLMIADGQGPTGIAGVMGGEESEITGDTGDLLFECAAFDRTSIRLTSRALGMRTEASGRFEKGVCPATAREAVDRACQFVNLLGAGDVVAGVYDHYPNPAPTRRIACSVARISRRAGVDIPGGEMVRILAALHFEAALAGDDLAVTVPAFRQDVEGEADICEEVLRIYGYEHLRATALRGETTPGGRSPRIRAADQAKALLWVLGWHEIMNFSFVSPQLIDRLGLGQDDPRRRQLRLLNPLGEDTSVMRATLAPSMLQTLALNQSRNNPAARLFELAPVFDAAGREPGALPVERWRLCLGAYGPDCDFFGLRDLLLHLLGRFGIRARVTAEGEPYHHPGRAASLLAGEDAVATLGEAHPDTRAAFGLPHRALLAELDMDALLARAKPMGAVKPLPRFPAVTRDMALVMDEDVPVGDVLALVARAGRPLLEKADVFDVFRGAQVLVGKKSVAFSLAFRAADRTLSDTEVAPLFGAIVAACAEQFGAVLRA